MASERPPNSNIDDPLDSQLKAPKQWSGRAFRDDAPKAVSILEEETSLKDLISDHEVAEETSPVSKQSKGSELKTPDEPKNTKVSFLDQIKDQINALNLKFENWQQKRSETKAKTKDIDSLAQDSPTQAAAVPMPVQESSPALTSPASQDEQSLGNQNDDLEVNEPKEGLVLAPEFKPVLDSDSQAPITTDLPEFQQAHRVKDPSKVKLPDFKKESGKKKTPPTSQKPKVSLKDRFKLDFKTPELFKKDKTKKTKEPNDEFSLEDLPTEFSTPSSDIAPTEQKEENSILQKLQDHYPTLFKKGHTPKKRSAKGVASSAPAASPLLASKESKSAEAPSETTAKPNASDQIKGFIEKIKSKEILEKKKKDKPQVDDSSAPSWAVVKGDHEEKKGLFDRFIPVEEVIGLDIGASTLRASHIRDGSVISLVEYPLPDGVIEDGVLREPSVLSETIKAFWRQAGFKSKSVNFSVTNLDVALRTMRLAASNEEDLDLAISVNADSVLAPMNIENLVIDYAELSRSGNRIAIQVAAADKEMLNSYVKAVEAAGLFAVSCEIGPLASGRALLVPRDPVKAHALIDIGAETTSFIVASGTDIFFLRVIPIGGNDFTQAATLNGSFSWQEAEQLKRKIGLSGDVASSVGIDSNQVDQVRQAMLHVSDQLLTEIVQTRRFYEELPDGRQLLSLTAFGGGSLLKGLVDLVALFANFNQQRPLKPRPGFEIIPDFEDYVCAIGLGMGHAMSLIPDVERKSFNINLRRRRQSKLTDEKTKQQTKRLTDRRAKKVALSSNKAALLVAALIVGGGYFYANNVLGPENEKLTNAAPEESAIDSQPATVNSAPRYVRTGLSTDIILNDTSTSLNKTVDTSILPQLLDLFDDRKVSSVELALDPTTITLKGILPENLKPEVLEQSIQRIRGLSAANIAFEEGAGGAGVTVVFKQYPAAVISQNKQDQSASQTQLEDLIAKELGGTEAPSKEEIENLIKQDVEELSKKDQAKVERGIEKLYSQGKQK